MLISLKIAYDESVKHASPGFLLQQEIIRFLFNEQKVHVMEFYGRIREGWTLKWTDEVRSLFHVNCFRNQWWAKGQHLLRASQLFLQGKGVS